MLVESFFSFNGIQKIHKIDLILLIAYSGIASTGGAIVAVSVSGFLLLLLLIVFLCMFKQRKAKKERRAAEVTQEDENPVYGDYVDPDPTAEVEDTNAYYSSGYVDY